MVKGQQVFFVKPLTYMNKSGLPIYKFASYYKIDIEDIIIIHDDVDLEFGEIKIVKNRGHGGHNGVRSIIKVFGSKDCIRIRVGIGNPKSEQDLTGHVFGRFSPDEIKALDSCIDRASAACLSVFENGVNSAMNLFNTKHS